MAVAKAGHQELQRSLPVPQPCSPVLWPPVVQPAGPAGEAEHGVEGAFQAVQRPLWGQQGQCQGQDRDITPAQHCPTLGLAQKTGNQLIPSPARHKVTSHNVVTAGTRAVSTSTLDLILGGKRNRSGIEAGPAASATTLFTRESQAPALHHPVPGPPHALPGKDFTPTHLLLTSLLPMRSRAISWSSCIRHTSLSCRRESTW